MTVRTESRSRACMTYAEVKPVFDEVHNVKNEFCAFMRLCVFRFTLYIKRFPSVRTWEPFFIFTQEPVQQRALVQVNRLKL